MLAFVLSIALADPYAVRGLDTPIVTQRTVVGHDASGDIVTTCRVYARVAVLATNDPLHMGLSAVSIRVRAPGSRADAACAPAFTGATADVSVGVGREVDGVAGRWLFLSGADGFGDDIEMTVVDVETAAPVLQVERSITSGVVVDAHGALTFSLISRIACDVHDPACAADARKKIGVPDGKTVTFDAKSCAFNPDTDQLAAVPVHVDLAHPVVTFAGGAAHCTPAP